MSLTSVTSQSIDESSTTNHPGQPKANQSSSSHLDLSHTPGPKPQRTRKRTLSIVRNVSSQFNDSRTAIQPEKDIRPDPSSANTAVHVSLSSRYLQFSKNTAKTQKLAVRQIPPREPSTKASRDTLVKSRQHLFEAVNSDFDPQGATGGTGGPTPCRWAAYRRRPATTSTPKIHARVSFLVFRFVAVAWRVLRLSCRGHDRRFGPCVRGHY